MKRLRPLAFGLLAVLFSVLAVACASPMGGPSATPTVSGSAGEVDLGVRFEAPGVEVAVDPLGEIFALLGWTPGEAEVATMEAEGLVEELEALLVRTTDPEKKEEIRAALIALREGLSKQAEAGPASAEVPPVPTDGSPLSWILWGLATAAGVGGIVTGRKAVSTALSGAVAAAKDLLAKYDAEPYTPADVESIDAARRGESKPVE